MDFLFLAIGLLAGAIIGFLLARVNAAKQEKSTADQLRELSVEKETLSAQNHGLKSDLEQNKQDLVESREKYERALTDSTSWKSKYDALAEKLESQKSELQELQATFKKEFELVANKILEEKSVKFTDQNKKNIDSILNPLKERIVEFQKKVEDTNEKNVERVATLDKHLQMLRSLNQEITQETRSLTQALRGDSKAQGNWGEMLLESILNKAGLKKDIHYYKEKNLKTDEGANQRPDYIINLPGKKHVVLDSKVSLTAYSNYLNSNNEEEQSQFLKQHLDSINGHIKLLGNKDYQNSAEINSPDYVLMFIANEPALTTALSTDLGIFEKALKKNIVLVSSTTLLATLSTISYIWKQEQQNKNAAEIARQAKGLYEKFVGFSNDLIKLGNQIKTVSGTHDAAMTKLTGKDSLVRKTERLKDLGVSSPKSIDQNLLDKSNEE